MKKSKDWYSWQRNGIYSIAFKDKITGDRLTAKSTGTRDEQEAFRIASKWFYDPDSFFNKGQKTRNKQLLEKLLNSIDLEDAEVQEILKTALAAKGFYLGKEEDLKNSIPILINKNFQTYETVKPIPTVTDKTNLELYPEAIRPIAQKIDTLKFTDYILTYWNYEESPYIKHLYNTGAKVPNPEWSNDLTYSYKKYFSIYKMDYLLKDVKAEDINIFLGKIKNNQKLADSSMKNLREGIAQALRFAYKHKIIKNNIVENIIRFSNKPKVEKQIFTIEEIKLIANKEKNIFGQDVYFIINRLLFSTGCRIGEILALRVSDIIKTETGIALNISENWCYHSNRIKSTKTERRDIIPLSSEMTFLLLDYTKDMQKDEFIFKAENHSKRPLSYMAVYNNFKKSLAKVGILRKGLTLHSYRHTFATRLLEAGYTECQLMFLTRHESIEQIKLYSNHDNAERNKIKQEAINLTEQLLA